MSAGPRCLAADWPSAPGVQAWMSTRCGGISAPPFDSLNLGMHCGDEADKVTSNRTRLREVLSLPAPPRWLRQVHSVRVVQMVCDGETVEPEADGAWTLERGVVLAVMAADCLPVLLRRDDGAVVAALHAGWRGLAAGILEEGLAALPGSPERYCAWLGPRIGPRHFLVRDDVRQAFDGSADAAAFVPAADGRWHADLGALATRRIERAGAQVSDSRLCTYSEPERFFSHRRDGRCGRMAALIWRD